MPANKDAEDNSVVNDESSDFEVEVELEGDDSSGQISLELKGEEEVGLELETPIEERDKVIVDEEPSEDGVSGDEGLFLEGGELASELGDEGVSVFQQQELAFEDADDGSVDQTVEPDNLEENSEIVAMFEDVEEHEDGPSETQQNEDSGLASAEQLKELDLAESLTLEGQIEALVFASPKPIKSQDIRDLVSDDENEVSLKDVESTLQNLQKLYEERAGGFTLNYEVGIGYQFQTVPASSYLMERMFSSRPRPLSRAALETLSIIAYRQPSTRAEIEYIRGVDAGSIIKNLMDRGLLECVGRKEDSGRPMLFGTTAEFLKVFRIDSLEQLPPLASFQPSPETAEASLQEPTEPVDVEEFIGDEEEETHEVSEGLTSDPTEEDSQELSGPSGHNELDNDVSPELDAADEESVDSLSGASLGIEELVEGKDGTIETTEVDIPTGASVPSTSREVDSGGEG